MSSKWAHHDFQCELSVSSNSSLGRQQTNSISWVLGSLLREKEFIVLICIKDKIKITCLRVITTIKLNQVLKFLYVLEWTFYFNFLWGLHQKCCRQRVLFIRKNVQFCFDLSKIWWSQIFEYYSTEWNPMRYFHSLTSTEL